VKEAKDINMEKNMRIKKTPLFLKMIIKIGKPPALPGRL
jgi:hypothetical protein